MPDREPQLLRGEEETPAERKKRIKEEVRRQERRRKQEATAPRGDLKTFLGAGLRFLTRK